MARKRNIDLARAIGARARTLRRAAGFTQEAVAEAVGLQSKAISRFENGAVGLSVTTLLEIATVLGVPLARFFEDPTGAQPPVDTEEQALLEQWRSLSPGHREQLRALLRWARSDVLVHDANASTYGQERPPPTRRS
jgi:transcriptional regulator with XRE-family HTH domain